MCFCDIFFIWTQLSNGKNPSCEFKYELTELWVILLNKNRSIFHGVMQRATCTWNKRNLNTAFKGTCHVNVSFKAIYAYAWQWIMQSFMLNYNWRTLTVIVLATICKTIKYCVCSSNEKHMTSGDQAIPSDFHTKKWSLDRV